jgi:sugar phosphate permease
MKRLRLTPPTIVLGLLCLMYLITYIDRVNLSTAADAIKRELGLSNTQLGFLQSGFGYPYLVFQIFGGWVGDRFGPRRTLFLCGLVWATATILTGFSGGLVSLFICRLFVGIGEGATFPVATRAMQSWTPAGSRGFAQGLTHSFARLGNAVTPPVVAWLIAAIAWRGSFIVLGCCSLAWVLAWVWYFRDTPAEHLSMTAEDLEQLPSRGARATIVRPRVPWRALTKRMAPVTIVYFCYGWTLWLYLTWLPQYFLHEYKYDLKKSALFTSAVFFSGVVGDYLGGVVSDRILHRTRDLQKARRNVVIMGFAGSFVCMLPVFLTHDLVTIILALGAAFFFAELVIGPMWSIPMDIAGKFSGTAAGMMNTGSALAAILSPIAFGVIIDWTGNWQLPFAGSLGFLLLGALLAPTMHPERPFEESELNLATLHHEVTEDTR